MFTARLVRQHGKMYEHYYILNRNDMLFELMHVVFELARSSPFSGLTTRSIAFLPPTLLPSSARGRPAAASIHPNLQRFASQTATATAVPENFSAAAFLNRASVSPSFTSSSSADDQHVSIQFSILDQPGVLLKALEPFSRHQVNLSRIESRPTKPNNNSNGNGNDDKSQPAPGATFDFFVDLEGSTGEARVQAVLRDLQAICTSVQVAASKEVPWFPRRMADLDLVASVGDQSLSASISTAPCVMCHVPCALTAVFGKTVVWFCDTGSSTPFFFILTFWHCKHMITL